MRPPSNPKRSAWKRWNVTWTYEFKVFDPKMSFKKKTMKYTTKFSNCGPFRTLILNHSWIAMCFHVLWRYSPHLPTAKKCEMFFITHSWISPNPKENRHVAAFNGMCLFDPSVLSCLPYCFCLVQQHLAKRPVLSRQNIQMVEIEGKMMPKQWLDNCINVVILL